MKFSCERDSILKEISIAQDIIASKNTLSILANVLLNAEGEKLTIKATDLKVSFETTIPVEIKNPGSTTVYCDKLLGILRSLPEGELEFDLQEDLMLFIRPVFKKVDFKLKCIPGDKYPEMKEIEEGQYFEVPQKELVDMVSKTLFAVSNDESRYFMNGVFFEGQEQELMMVATDGRRLAYVRKQIPSGGGAFKGVIVPTKILALIKRLSSGEGTIGLAIRDNTFFSRFSRQRMTSSLIEAQFPNYNRVIPEKQEHLLVVEREALLTALKRVSLLVEDKSKRILVSAKSGLLTVSSEESDVGMAREEIACSYEGPEITIALNYLYLMEPLREMSEDNVSFEFTENNKAITMKPVPEKDYFHIVMPMQIG